MGARADRRSTQPRRQRRRVEEVAGVEQGGQQDDPRPGQAARDVADGGELGGAGEDDEAHRHRLDDREAGLASGQPVDEPEADGRDRDPDRVGRESPAARPRSRARRCRGAVTSLSAGRSCRRSRRRRPRARGARPHSPRRGGGRRSPQSGTSRPTSARCASSGVASVARTPARSARARSGSRSGRPFRLGLARVRIVLADVRAHDTLRCALGRGRDRWRRRVSAVRHRRREYRIRARRNGRFTRPPAARRCAGR